MSQNVIFHVDVNSAFLSWQAIHMLHTDSSNIDIRTIPAIICGDPGSRHGIVLAKSIPAKKYGIVTGEPVTQALRKCPTLQLVSPSYDLYGKCSKALMELLRKYAPTVEQFSIDEAFCDMTGTTLLYGDPIDFAHKLKDEIRDTLGFSVNIGISSNHLLAKMASDFQKPDKVHTLFPEEISSKMWPLPVSDLLFVGKSTASYLNKLGIYTIGELAKSNPDFLQDHLKKAGLTAWQYANGICEDFDSDHTTSTKGYSCSTTLAEDVTSPAIAKEVLLSLCETVSARIRADGSKAGVVSITIRNSNFENHSKQTSLYSSTSVTEELYLEICSLFDKLWDGSPIRLLGVSCSKSGGQDEYQYDLFHSEKHEKLEKLDLAIDKVRARYGDDSIKRATLLNKKSIRRR